MSNLWGESLSRAEVRRRTGDIRQLAGAQPFELVEGSARGTRAVRLYNAAGLDLDVITDRGMGITRLTFGGMPLAWRTPIEIAHPAYVGTNGLEFLDTWPAGFTTICGLTQVGSPAEENGEALGQHGRANAMPASEVRWGGEWLDDDYRVWVEGTLHEVSAFGLHLAFRRRLWLNLAEPVLYMEDHIENLGSVPTPFMLLQHFNLGYPLISPQTRLELPPAVTEPRDEDARPGLATCQSFSEPIDGYTPQVFYHDLQPDTEGRVAVRLVNPALHFGKELGIAWMYRKSDYPILVQWKMMTAGSYVVGIEPSNCHVEGRPSERERGTLQVLAPQESHTLPMEIRFWLQ
jgi:hypothetical protein